MGRIIDFLLGPKIERTAAPQELDGLLGVMVPEWYNENLTGEVSGSRLARRVWTAARCQQMNAQQISTMPLEFHGPEGAEPLWMTNPDDEWYPNGISDAIFSIIDQMYGHGFALLYITSRYVTGYPRTWTVLDSGNCDVKMVEGRRVYTVGNAQISGDDIIQIDRNPGSRLRGTSALEAYASVANALVAADTQAKAVNSGAYPTVYLQPKRKLDRKQAEMLQAQWMERTQDRNGAPPVVPPDIDVKELSISLEGLSLLTSREFGARAICTAYGVPSVLLNLALQGGLTYQNPSAVGESWWRFELRPVSTRLEDAFSNQLLPRGQYVTVKADDTFAPLTPLSPEDDPQAANTSPAIQPTALLPTPAPVVP